MRVVAAPVGTSRLPSASVPLDASSVCSMRNAPLMATNLAAGGILPSQVNVPSLALQVYAHSAFGGMPHTAGAGTPRGRDRLPARATALPSTYTSALASGVVPSGASSLPVMVAALSGDGAGAGAGPGAGACTGGGAGAS